MNEQQIQHKIIKYLESNGYYVVKIIAANKSGVPDVIAAKDGKVIFIEVKTLIGKLSPLQKYNIKKIQKCGNRAIIVHSAVELYSQLLTEPKQRLIFPQQTIKTKAKGIKALRNDV